MMIIDEAQLLHRFGFERRGDLQKCLDRQRIPYFTGKGGKIVTTLQAINQVLIDNPKSDNNGPISFT